MKRILVADDSVTIQKVIALTFADEPFEVQSVGTGSEALELVKSWKPDIVLADVIMPQMNGYELCKAVKQLDEAGSIPVLLLAGTFEAFDEEEAKSVGANDFITKPFESGELIDKVKTLIGDAPAAPQVEPSPVADEEPITVEPVEVPEAAAAEKAPSPVPENAASEPDIWDILSGSGDDVLPKESGGGEQAGGFGPIEDTGVVDVGSFDVGIGRPESQPAPSQAADDVSPETPQVFEVPEIPETAPQPELQAPAAVQAADVQQQDMDEKSRVENMEKDFFGFETGAVEEAAATDLFEEAVEEVTFEMEVPPDPQAPAPEEASFVVPEPVQDQAIVTGETVAPETMAPGQPPAEGLADPGAMRDELEDRPAPVTASVPEPVEIVELPSEPSPDPEAAPEPSFSEAPPVANGPALAETPASPEPVADIDPFSDAARDVPPIESSKAPDLPSDLELQPEPALELPVDLAPEFSGDFSPEPAEETVVGTPVEAPPGPAVSVPDTPATGSPADIPAPAAVDALDEDAIRKVVEEKVEKIVWEVVPEMAEVIIREAIQKIKDGS